MTYEPIVSPALAFRLEMDRLAQESTENLESARAMHDEAMVLLDRIQQKPRRLRTARRIVRASLPWYRRMWVSRP